MLFDRTDPDERHDPLGDEISWAIRTGTLPPAPSPRSADLTRVPERELLGELVSRGGKVNLTDIPDSELWRELGRRRQAKRKVHRGGRGRPRKLRCACGRCTQDAARKRGHVCPAQPASGGSSR